MTTPSTASPLTLEISIAGMDCAECAAHVQRAIAGTPGVQSVEMLLAAAARLLRHK